MQLFVTYIVLFVTAVKARLSDFYFFHCGPYQLQKWSRSDLRRIATDLDRFLLGQVLLDSIGGAGVVVVVVYALPNARSTWTTC